MELRDDRHCFVCGQDNAGGLRLIFEVDRPGRAISTEFVPSRTHQGYMGIVHGGIIATVLDEAMTKLAFSLGMDAVTGRLTVRFKSPLMTGERVLVAARLTRETGRAVEAVASAVKDDGTVVAEADGLLMKLAKKTA